MYLVEGPEVLDDQDQWEARIHLHDASEDPFLQRPPHQARNCVSENLVTVRRSFETRGFSLTIGQWNGQHPTNGNGQKCEYGPRKVHGKCV
jgi:hypothetical protein